MSYVYIFRNGNENLFKIGKSVDVEDRIRGFEALLPAILGWQYSTRSKLRMKTNGKHTFTSGCAQSE